ncbi:hypothetical protein V5738_17815 [Salinisphaera sp. SPP-AMP-43]|uniref:hypothetical protein n=1 Tax=Salinisphaera sp. SPP-AMP-43 TaxID=3121288 RepID=UPI003C6E1A23
MKLRPRDPWFPRKRIGWGWGLPRRWPGWGVLLAALVALIGLTLLWPTPQAGALYYGLTTIVVGLLVLTAWWTGERLT